MFIGNWHIRCRRDNKLFSIHAPKEWRSSPYALGRNYALGAHPGSQQRQGRLPSRLLHKDGLQNHMSQFLLRS